jgi:hypothetical protein
MKKNFPNILIKNALESKDIAEIFETVNNTSHKTFLDTLCYYSWHIKLPEHIENKFLKYAENIAGTKLKLLEYNFSRYEIVENYHPLLFPHTDEAFSGPRVTLDYQVRSNIKWPIVVDDWENQKEFLLQDNEILTFSGTHQIHWRPKQNFDKDNFLEAIFLHFEPVDAKPLSIDHINEMRDHGKLRWKEWQNTEGIGSNSLNPDFDIYRYERKSNG